MSQIKQLETERLILRKLNEDDANIAYKNWTSDNNVSRYVRWNTHKNIEETREYIKWEINRCNTEDYYAWGIVIKEKSELIGVISAFPSDDNRYEFGYNISKKYWNNGYTTEALKKALDYLTNEVGIHKYICSHAVENPASGEVMKKAGFKYVKNITTEKFDKSVKFETKVYYLDN